MTAGCSSKATQPRHTGDREAGGSGGRVTRGLGEQGEVGKKAANLSSPARASRSSAVRLGKSSSLSLAFPAAIFFSSSPREAAAAESTAAAESDTPHDFMETQRHWQSHGDQRERSRTPASSSSSGDHTTCVSMMRVCVPGRVNTPPYCGSTSTSPPELAVTRDRGAPHAGDQSCLVYTVLSV